MTRRKRSRPAGGTGRKPGSRRGPPPPRSPLPPPRPRPTIPAQRGPTPGKGPLFWISYLLIAVVFVVLNPPPAVVTLPQELEGVWRTDMRQYAKRRLIIRSDMVTFQVADDSASVVQYYVTGVTATPHKRAVLYSVEYSETGSRRASMTLEFLFYAGPPPEIEFRNQPEIVWRRAQP